MKNIKSLIRIYKQLGAIITKKQLKGAVAVFLSMIICSALELIGVSAIFPFLQAMSDIAGVRNEWYGRMIYTFFPNATDVNTVVIIGIVIIVVYLLKNSLAIVCAHIKYKYTFRLKREAATLMLKSYMERPYEYFLNNNSSKMILGIDTDTGSLNHILLDTFGILSESLTILLIGIYLLKKDAFVALMSFLLALACFSYVTFGFKKVVKKAGILTRDAISKQNKYSYQAINGIKEITVLDRNDYFTGKYEEAAKGYEKANIINNTVLACPDRLLEGVCISGFMAIICIRISVNPDIIKMLPVLGSFAMGTFKVLPSIAKISNHFNQIVYNQYGLAECYDNIMTARKIVQEKNELEQKYRNNQNHEIRFLDKLEIINIVWKYETAKDVVLRNANLVIKKGESVAFVGPSGAGKTTLADIIMGLLIPQSGNVLVDGINIYAIPHLWAKMIGYVPQTVFLIDDTIRANIAFGIPDADISDDKVLKALEQAQLLDFVKGLPDGINTLVGERGTKLSGGQRQRIAIARALYNDPEILVLDEATSALDNETEAAVMEAIEKLSGKKTLIIVAHRLTTVRNCNRAYRIFDGIATEVDVDDLVKK